MLSRIDEVSKAALTAAAASCISHPRFQSRGRFTSSDLLPHKKTNGDHRFPIDRSRVAPSTVRFSPRCAPCRFVRAGPRILKGRSAGAVSSRAHRSERNIVGVLPVIQSSTISPASVGLLKLAAHWRLTRYGRDKRDITQAVSIAGICIHSENSNFRIFLFT